ncbi:MAG: hypothetical protein UHK60_08065 [Acutalibacteraceae bacterium]|nr:hypothetical protein [Acutalibacteraceae bacterium]
MENRQNSLLFQYKNSPKIKTIYEGLYNLAVQASPDDLKNVYDLDNAAGEWLNLIGSNCNVPRWYAALNDAFTLDIDYLDDPTIVLDGQEGSINDFKYRALIKLSLFRRRKAFSIPNIYAVLKEAFNPYSIDIIEGNATMTINLVFANIADLRVFNALYGIDNNLLGRPTGATVTINRSVL